jgi:hypothetical protein
VEEEVMRRIVASFVFGYLVMLAAPTVARAAQDAAHVTNEPAATLLLPYFEAQVPAKIGGKGKGINTLFSINNASASSALAHVTVWSDLAIPVINFDVYLTGYDVVRINMQDILNGIFPLTADAGADQTQVKITPKGPLSQDINFPGASGPCGSPDTLYGEPLPDASIQHIRAALTGKFSPLLNGCFGLDYGDKKPIARGFVTVDSIFNCNVQFPNEAGYSANVDNRDILWGDYEILDKTKKIARADALVHVRSTQTFGGLDPQVGDPGEYTFYGRFEAVAGKVARQPLATKFAASYANRGKKDKLFPQGTALTVWRDPKVSDADPFPCGTRPSWFPLAQEEVLAFDAQENVEVLAPGTAFGAATQRVPVDGPSLPTSFLEGWIYLNLNTTVAGAAIPAEDPAAAQAWVTVDKNSKGKFSVQTRAIPLDSATDVLHQQLSN